ncbi:MAG TPA: TRAFs-binding domain-containing protein [Vicinamibacterales bacterium]
MTGQKTCFVVQGFGEKTDLATGRALNLDASYEVIKEAVEAAGLRCVRADEIVHSGTIDGPMYDALFRADLVVADLSTSNLNAAYELGVRYGVRPRATIIVAEQQFKNPFDFSHIVIRRYEHLGSDVGRREAARFKAELMAAIKQIVDNDAIDSPVYTFLRLDPPAEAARPRGATVQAEVETPEQNAKQLLDIARAEMARNSFVSARGLLETVLHMRPRDDYVVQQLALATYKSEQPDPRSALVAAREHLRQLDPDVTNDPETLGLWGAVHKRLWDIDQDRSYLDAAIGAYERGFYLKQDYYNGINLAFLLNVRAALQRENGDRSEAIADFVVARRVRRDVIRYCEHALEVATDPAARYWVLATLWEAAFGLGDRDTASRWQKEAEAATPAPWMLDTTRGQLDRLSQLLAEPFWATA